MSYRVFNLEDLPKVPSFDADVKHPEKCADMIREFFDGVYKAVAPLVKTANYYELMDIEFNVAHRAREVGAALRKAHDASPEWEIPKPDDGWQWAKGPGAEVGFVNFAIPSGGIVPVKLMGWPAAKAYSFALPGLVRSGFDGHTGGHLRDALNIGVAHHTGAIMVKHA